MTALLSVVVTVCVDVVMGEKEREREIVKESRTIRKKLEYEMLISQYDNKKSLGSLSHQIVHIRSLISINTYQSHLQKESDATHFDSENPP